MFAKEYVLAPSTYVGAQFWDNTHPLTDAKNAAWEKFVPLYGSTSSVEAELFLAANRLGYDYYNNGFCNNPVYAVRFIEDNCKTDPGVKKALSIIGDYQNSCGDDDEGGEVEGEGEPEPDCLEVNFKNRSVDWALDYLVEFFLGELLAADAAETLTPLKEGEGLFN